MGSSRISIIALLLASSGCPRAKVEREEQLRVGPAGVEWIASDGQVRFAAPLTTTSAALASSLHQVGGDGLPTIRVESTVTFSSLGPLLLAIDELADNQPVRIGSVSGEVVSVELSKRDVFSDVDGCAAVRVASTDECAALTIAVRADGTSTVSNAVLDSLPRPDRPLPRPILFTECGSVGIMTAPKTAAGFEIEAVETLVARDRQAIEACWGAAEHPLLPRRSAVRIEVAPSGEVARIHPDVFDRSDESIEACLAQAVASWKFSPSSAPVCLQIPVGDPSPAASSRCRPATVTELELGELQDGSAACWNTFVVVGPQTRWAEVNATLLRLAGPAPTQLVIPESSR